MRRGLLTDYANSLCGMATGWQWSNQIDLLREHRVGTLDLDLLLGTAQIDGTPVRMADGVALLRSWLLERADQDGVGRDAVESATISVDFDCEERSQGERPQWRFHDFGCRSRVSAAGHVATGGLHKTEVGVFDPWGVGWTLYEGPAVPGAVWQRFPELRARYEAARDHDG